MKTPPCHSDPRILRCQACTIGAVRGTTNAAQDRTSSNEKLQLLGLAAWLWFSAASPLMGAPVIYQATGATAADIQSVVDQFKRDISFGGVNNGDQPGSLPNGWREITGDNYFVRDGTDVDFVNQGLCIPAGISGNNAVISDATGPGRLFGNINESYPLTFQTFGSERIIGTQTGLAPHMDFTFHRPGTQVSSFSDRAFIRAIGIVLTDVDFSDVTTFRLGVLPGLDPVGPLTISVPPTPVNGGFSFLGVRFDDESRFIGSFGLGLGSNGLNPGIVDGGLTDLVAINQIIIPEPQKVPEPTTLTLIGFVVLLLLLFHRRRTGVDLALR